MKVMLNINNMDKKAYVEADNDRKIGKHLHPIA